jgi:uncharacterized protein (TIGR03437 family)
MFAQFRLNARIFILAVILSLSLWAIIIKRPVDHSQAATAAASVVSVNAASFLGPLAPATIAAAFGTNLATGSESAQSLPLPTQLRGTRLQLIDSSNTTHSAPLFFVSPGQINYQIPEQVAVGTAQVVVTNGNGVVSQGTVQIANSSPALFTASYNGRGVPIALTTFDGVNFESVVNPDGSARAIGCGTAWRPNYLTLFGTGLRRASNLRVRIGGADLTPIFAGAQGTFAGLDQVNVMIPSNLPGGLTDISITAEGLASNTVQLLVQAAAAPTQTTLSVNDVQTIIAQAVAKAQQVGLKVTVAVVDREGNVLGVFRMTDAPATTRIGAFDLVTRARLRPTDPDGLQDVDVPSSFAAISKAGTAAFFSTQGSAISSRTASFIVQDHFPPRVPGNPGGPLFGVQFSQLPCSDIKIPNLPLGLSGDPGGVPIYKNGVAAGGVGVEGDGLYSVDVDSFDFDQPLEEVIAVAATLGFDTPPQIRIDTVQVDGMTLPFVNVTQTGGAAPPFASLPGAVDPLFPIRPTQASLFSPLTLGGVPGRVDSRFFPFKGSAVTSLTAADVNRIITQAAQQANRTRAAIRRPIGVPAEVNIAVIDTTGAVLGLFSTQDAPIFGFDVSVQKARTAAFFSLQTAGAQLRMAGFGKFVDAAAADGVRLDGAFAFSDRAVGFLSRPFFPDGIDGTLNGPFSKPFNVWSPFNVGLQLALVKPALVNILSGNPVAGCTAIPVLPNGIQIFAGSVPLFKNGVLVGAIGISGDGIDQDDIIADTGAEGFKTPDNLRADQLTPRGVRLPWVKYPRHPNIP